VTDEYDDLDLLTDGIKYPAGKFRNPEFIREYRPLFARYLDMRVAGKPARSAFLQCFGAGYFDQWFLGRIEALEGGEHFQAQLEKKRAEADLTKVFDLKDAVYGWLDIIHNPETRDSSRVAALKELQVLYGMTMIDANGNTRAGKVLADFYKESDRAKPITSATGDLHAEPGSPEAKAFEDSATE